MRKVTRWPIRDEHGKSAKDYVREKIYEHVTYAIPIGGIAIADTSEIDRAILSNFMDWRFPMERKLFIKKGKFLKDRPRVESTNWVGTYGTNG